MSIAGFLYTKEKEYEEAKVRIGVAAPEFKWNNYWIVDWIHDIRSRIEKIQINTKKSKLDELESRLNAIVSPELRTQLELEAIAGELTA